MYWYSHQIEKHLNGTPVWPSLQYNFSIGWHYTELSRGLSMYYRPILSMLVDDDVTRGRQAVEKAFKEWTVDLGKGEEPEAIIMNACFWVGGVLFFGGGL